MRSRAIRSTPGSTDRSGAPDRSAASDPRCVRRRGHHRPHHAVEGRVSYHENVGGEPTMVLSAAGHIQSLINPPRDAAKRQYFLNPRHPDDPDEWLKAATPHKGSWWGHWLALACAALGEPNHRPRNPAARSIRRSRTRRALTFSRSEAQLARRVDTRTTRIAIPGACGAWCSPLRPRAPLPSRGDGRRFRS
jgi:hypothetical protein